jgi:hypothetical protein
LISARRATSTATSAERWAHPEIAAAPADALDAVMTELLDVQDDLSRVVEWLAENWSADLPVPALWGSSSRPGRKVDVTVLCDGWRDLCRVAELLENGRAADHQMIVPAEFAREDSQLARDNTTTG